MFTAMNFARSLRSTGAVAGSEAFRLRKRRWARSARGCAVALGAAAGVLAALAEAVAEAAVAGAEAGALLAPGSEEAGVSIGS